MAAALPYRRAHWVMAALFLFTIAGFWRSYFSVLGDAPLAHHLHGITATLWMVLLAGQSVLIHKGNRQQHKRFGKALFVLAPLMIASGLLVTHVGAVQAVSGESPFYNLFGTRLNMLDVLNCVMMGVLVYLALKHRRDPALHSGYLFATMVMLVPPALSRFFANFVPGFVIYRPELLGERFTMSLYASLAVAFIGSLVLAFAAKGRARQPWMVSIGLCAVMLVVSVFVEEGGTFMLVSEGAAALAPLPSFVVGFLFGLVCVWLGWKVGSPKEPLFAAHPAE